MEFKEKYHEICLKNKLQTNLKYYLLGSNKPYNLLYQAIDLLKTKYNDTISVNHLNYLQQHVDNYICSNESLHVEEWVFNWNNISFIQDVNNFVDTSRNYEIEQKIHELQQSVEELKEINLGQNITMKTIEDNTS